MFDKFSFKKNILLVFALNILIQIVNLIQKILFARVFTKSDLGIYFAIQSFISIFLIIFSLGMQDYIIRKISIENFKKLNQKTYSIFISVIKYSYILIIPTSIFLLYPRYLSLTFFNSEKYSQYIIIIFILILLKNYVDFFGNTLQGSGLLILKSLLNDLLPNLILILLLFLLPFIFENNLSVIFYYFVVFYFIYILITIYKFKSSLFDLKNDLKINKTKIKEIFKFSLPIYLSSLINFPLSFIPLYILKKFDPDFVSIFNLSISIAALIYISTTIFENIYVPKWGNYLVNNYYEKIIISYKFITRWNFFVVSILFTTFLISQDQIITLLYTVKYIDINKYLYLFLISILLSTITGPSEGIIKVFGDTKYIFFSRIISSVLCIILIFILPFYFGKFGIILTYSVSAIIGNIFYSFFIYFKYKIHPFDRSYFIILLIFILSFLISYLFLPFKNIVSNNIVHVFIIFIIIFFINIIFFLLLRFLMNSEDKNLHLLKKW